MTERVSHQAHPFGHFGAVRRRGWPFRPRS